MINIEFINYIREGLMKLKNLIRYTLFWCGMPKSKNIHEGDVILAQSFGRNSIVVTHKRQIVRVAYVIKKLLGKFPLISETQLKSFDRNSLQRETRNLFSWSLKEPFVRMYYIVKRYV